MEKFYKFIKTTFLLLSLLFSLSVNASEFQDIDYKNLKDNTKIKIENGIWSNKVNKKSVDYYTKKSSGGALNYSEFYSHDNIFLFSTGTQYEFINKGRLIGYSNTDLKFYEFDIKEGMLIQRELLEDEVQELFPKYKIIKISQFSDTNSLKLKKHRNDLKIILYNDTDRIFNNYWFYSNNSKFKPYKLKGFIDITQKGMIQFSRFGDNSKKYPWFVILIR